MDAYVGSFQAFLVECANGLFLGWRNCGNNECAALNVVSVEFDGGGRLAILVGSRVHHEDLFLGAHARDDPVVAYPYEQPASVGIGKCRYRFG